MQRILKSGSKLRVPTSCVGRHKTQFPYASYANLVSRSFSSVSPILESAPSSTLAPEKTPERKTVFSGIQPTGIPHLGNYLGALRQWVVVQNNSPKTDKLIYCLVDLHAITQPQDPSGLRQWKKEALATLLAIGLAPERCIIFEQSKVPAHSELMWILSCTTSMGALNRMTQWKSKASLNNDEKHEAQSIPSLKLGLFSYPVLQAADILVHSATHVPVGEDQSQHLELTRDLATSFNHHYGKTFPLPQTVLSPAKRVMSLRNPNSKMSKSDTDPKSRILLSDSPETIRAKFRAAVTDSLSEITYDPIERPGVSNLIEIYAHMQDRDDFVAIAEEFKNLTLKDLKDRVSDCVIEGLAGIRQEFEKLMSEGEQYLEEVSLAGAEKAQRSAEETLGRARRAVGL
ncbi:hypothetical protein BDZ91DRAFT_676364 [Kalaharituber pfeilii]|nr:hypothetical protein BDZ91DRAFT_676364 [Kalaharituber pfeilii]